MFKYISTITDTLLHVCTLRGLTYDIDVVVFCMMIFEASGSVWRMPHATRETESGWQDVRLEIVAIFVPSAGVRLLVRSALGFCSASHSIAGQ